MENLELRVEYLMKSREAERSPKEERGGTAKPNIPGPCLCRGNEVSLETVVETGGGKQMVRKI